MRLITFNLWHGLSPSSLVAFEALEPAERRRLREQLQIEVLKQAKPDLCFFQEVNPVVTRAPALAKALGMHQVFQPDLVGLKLFGLGLPLNLNSGLAILAAERFGLKFVDAVSLSRPGVNLVRSWGSWQLKEERFALFAETLLPKWGRVLLVDTHLHHGLEETPELLEKISKLGEELELPAATLTELKERLSRGNQRRQQEMEVLLEAIARHESRYEVVVLAGDFNASPESGLTQMLNERGFIDAWAEVHPDALSGLSFDRTQNVANHLLQDRFPLTLVVEDLTFSKQVKERLLALAREQEYRPRRIDYVWLRAGSASLKIEKGSLIGHPNAEGFAPSDHFGVCVDVEVD